MQGALQRLQEASCVGQTNTNEWATERKKANKASTRKEAMQVRVQAKKERHEGKEGKGCSSCKEEVAA
eukprot:7088475-Prorocentrum_lima.AAC.1